MATTRRLKQVYSQLPQHRLKRRISKRSNNLGDTGWIMTT